MLISSINSFHPRCKNNDIVKGKNISFEARTRTMIKAKVTDEFGTKVLDKVLKYFNEVLPEGAALTRPVFIKDEKVGFFIDKHNPDRQILTIKTDTTSLEDWDKNTYGRIVLNAKFDRDGRMITGDCSTASFSELFERTKSSRRIYTGDTILQPLRDGNRDSWIPVVKPGIYPPMRNTNTFNFVAGGNGIRGIFYEFARNDVSIYAK